MADPPRCCGVAMMPLTLDAVALRDGTVQGLSWVCSRCGGTVPPLATGGVIDPADAPTVGEG